MAIARTQNVSATSASQTLTSTTNGDVIVVWAYNGSSTTIPTLPAGFTNINSVAGTQQACRFGYKISTGGDTSTGTWTNATAVACLVYSGCSGIGASGSPSPGSSTTLSASAFGAGTIDASGNSWQILFYAAKSATTGMNTSPTGITPTFTNRTSQLTINACDAGPMSDSTGIGTITISPTSRWFTVGLEIKATAAPSAPLPELVLQPMVPASKRR